MIESDITKEEKGNKKECLQHALYQKRIFLMGTKKSMLSKKNTLKNNM